MRLQPQTVTDPSPAGGTAHEPVELHELLTVADVAELLRVSKSWVYEHTRSRAVSPSERLPHIRIGKYVRFEVQAVRAFLARKSQIR